MLCVADVASSSPWNVYSTSGGLFRLACGACKGHALALRLRAVFLFVRLFSMALSLLSTNRSSADSHSFNVLVPLMSSYLLHATFLLCSWTSRSLLLSSLFGMLSGGCAACRRTSISDCCHLETCSSSAETLSHAVPSWFMANLGSWNSPRLDMAEAQLD